jgi:hypothetical protein
MAKKPGGSSTLGKIRRSPSSSAQAEFIAMQARRKAHYKGECFERGASGEMSMSKLAGIHKVPKGTQGTRD